MARRMNAAALEVAVAFSDDSVLGGCWLRASRAELSLWQPELLAPFCASVLWLGARAGRAVKGGEVLVELSAQCGDSLEDAAAHFHRCREALTAGQGTCGQDARALEERHARTQYRRCLRQSGGMVLRAPRAGQVGEVLVKPGAVVSRGTPLLTWAEAKVRVLARFEGLQEAWLCRGRRAQVLLPSGQRLAARVERVPVRHQGSEQWVLVRVLGVPLGLAGSPVEVVVALV